MEFRSLSEYFPNLIFSFFTKDDVSIDDNSAIKALLIRHKIDFLVNCAAYTAVDKAEAEKEIALSINATAPGKLATICNELGIKFIHFSTDYVFDGNGSSPYEENDETNPVNFYGETKLEGEKNIMMNDPSAMIIRTSWVYSSYGKNFVKTMIRLMKERNEISVVNDQSGCPTYAADLAGIVLAMISKENIPAGIFHYANRGVITWYEFAVAIKEITNSACIIKPIPTTAFPTPAKRPSYSALQTEKIRKHTGMMIPGWRESLEKCIALISPL